MSPQRDIAHAFHDYLTRATQILEQGPAYRFLDHFEARGGTPDQILEVVKFWQRYFENCSNMEHVSQRDVFNASKFEDLDLSAVGAASTALMMVLLSAYFSGLREATFVTRPHENPVGVFRFEPETYLRPVGKFRTALRRFVYGLIRPILHAL